MNQVRFDWDDAKARQNERKHGVTFEEAITVFTDPNALFFDDPKHSTEREDRQKVVGFSMRPRLLSVVFTERNEAIRIINARQADAAEEAAYVGRFRASR